MLCLDHTAYIDRATARIPPFFFASSVFKLQRRRWTALLGSGGRIRTCNKPLQRRLHDRCASPEQCYMVRATGIEPALSPIKSRVQNQRLVYARNFMGGSG